MPRLISNLSSHTPQVSVFIYRTNRQRNERLSVIFYEAISLSLIRDQILKLISLSNFDVWYVPNVVLYVCIWARIHLSTVS